MATKDALVHIRIDSKTRLYIAEKSKELGYHHKMNNDLPDYSATVRHMINLFKQYDEAGVSLPQLENNY